MNYIENVFICLAVPLLLAVLCLRDRRGRTLLFLLAGMVACLFSSYISTFLAGVLGADALIAELEITPCIEETMKLFPILFYLLVFQPQKREAAGEAMMVAVGFATFENVCYLTANGASHTLHLLVRGFGTGAMHVVCGVMLSRGLFLLWDRAYLRTTGTLGLLCLAITYHAVYNVLLSQTGWVALTGYLIPPVTILLTLVFAKRRVDRRGGAAEGD